MLPPQKKQNVNNANNKKLWARDISICICVDDVWVNGQGLKYLEKKKTEHEKSRQPRIKASGRSKFYGWIEKD